jgi:hypothetical protein
MKRNCNENGTAMEVPLPTCFATLRKGIDGNNANDGYGKMGVVPGRKNCSPDSIQNFEHHTVLGSFRRLRSLRNTCTRGHMKYAIFSILPMLPKGGTHHPRYSVYLHVSPHPSFLLVGELWDHPPAGS